MSSFPLRTHDLRPLTLAELAEDLGVPAPAAGGEMEVTGLAALDRAGPTELGLVANPSFLKRLAASKAGALLVEAGLAERVAEREAADPGGRGRRPCLVVPDAQAAMRQILERILPEAPWEAEVHPTAVVHPTAILGEGVGVGPYAVVEAHVVVGRGSRIGAHAVVGAGARIGEDAWLLPQVVLYPGVVLGDRVLLHSGVRVGVDGFGYVFEEGAHRKIPQVGACVLGNDVEVGANAAIDRGSIGESRIGAGTKLDNLVHLGHNVTVGPLSLLTAQVGIAGSTRIGQGVVMGGQAGVAGHLHVGDGTRVAAQAGVIADVPPGETVMGFPARPRREFLRGVAGQQKIPELLRELRTLRARLEALEDAERSAPASASLPLSGPDPEAREAGSGGVSK
jgi:UDP-3-O-[3-hydroxymyristoyl] glucosamine N-acyltransferase